MDDKKKFARNLRRVRKGKGLTQEQLAELIDRSPEAVSHLERAISQPNLDTILRIRNALKVPITDLIDPVKDEATIDPKRRKLISELDSVVADMSDSQIEAVLKNAKIVQSLGSKS